MHLMHFWGLGDQSIRGPLTELFGFGLSIMEIMAVVKILTDEGRRRTDGKLFSKILMILFEELLEGENDFSYRGTKGFSKGLIH